MLQIATILHPTDFSALSQHAFHFACSLAKDHGSKLVVLHVADVPFVTAGEVLILAPSDGSREATEKQLRAIQPPDASIPTEHRLEEGEPVVEILRAARETGCDLIAMGSHGHTGLAHLLLGSVAEQVVRQAPCTVVVTKGPV